MAAIIHNVFRVLLSPLPWALDVLGVPGSCLLVLLLILLARVAHIQWKRMQLSGFTRPPLRNWLLGHMGKMNTNDSGLQEVIELVKMHHHSCAWFLGPFYNLVRFFHPDYIKPLLLASASITYKDEMFYGFMKPWLGQSLLLNNDKVWSRQRRLLTPAFHFDILKNYVHIFNSSTNIMHDKWRRLLAEGKNELEMFEQISLMTLDSLLKCTFSYDSHCQEKSSKYISAIYELSDLVVKRQRNLLHHFEWIYKLSANGRRFKKACEIVHKFTSSVIQERRSQLSQQPPETRAQKITTGYKRRVADFIEVLLLSEDENGKGLSNEEIKAQADTFMFAGHDTTASGISWLLHNLAMHQDYQDRCRSEINELLDGRDMEEITWEDLSELTFTTMCIKESLRLHPPVLALTRYYSQDIIDPMGRKVPQGTICLISVFGTHHNPDVWTNPEVYDPMRFDPAVLKQRSSYAFIPFSAGPRNCIGQNFAMAEIRVVLALTLRRFKIFPGSTQPLRNYCLTMRAEAGLHLKLEALTPS